MPKKKTEADSGFIVEGANSTFNTQTAPESMETVRVYEVTATMIAHQFPKDVVQQHKRKGERVASVEFIPPAGMSVEDLEKRYLETGGMVLIERVSKEEWDKRQAT